ncbi:MAG: response regulator [Deltaproteobacteria bacterium]|nr:response regulator [Deltaproteobacteria bacterium]
MRKPIAILHLEGNADDRERVRKSLESEGLRCTFVCVETRNDFLAAIDLEKFDLILADYMLPSFDGLSAFDILKQRRLYIPFIIVSGTPGEEPAIECLWSGVTDYVLKDRMSRLVPAVLRALDEAAERAARVQSEEALRESETKYRLLFENMTQGAFHQRADGYIVDVNPSALRMFGLPREEFTEIVSRPSSWEAVHENGSPFRDGELPPFAALAAGKPVGGVVAGVPNPLTGTRTWMEISAIPEFRPEESAPFQVAVTLHDITERKKLETQLRQAQKMEAAGMLAGGIAHDFNNALTGILGFSEVLKKHVDGNEEATEELDRIRSCAEHAATLTRQLLMFARRQEMKPANLDLNMAIRDSISLIRKLVGANIEVRDSLAAGLPAIKADRGQLEQVLMNLCINSRDAMPHGGRLLIETSEAVPGDEHLDKNPEAVHGRYAVLSISDTGTGMDEDVRKRAFEPFFTTKDPEKGSGLGLPVAYGIVRQHNGFINLSSEPGKGTVIRIYFPAAGAEPDGPAFIQESPIRGGTEAILLAEDEESLRTLFERILQEFGYTVVTASDGRKAVEAAKEEKDFSLAILDLVMPRMSGKEAFDALKKRRPDLKAIFMSGYSGDAIRDLYDLKSGVPFLQKPFGPFVLAKKVREVLDGD